MTVNRPEDSTLILPEDSWLKAEVARQTEKASNEQRRANDLVNKIASKQEEIHEMENRYSKQMRHVKEALEQCEKNASQPVLTIEYGPNPETNNRQGLIITNNRDPAFNLAVSDISNGWQIASFPEEIGTLVKDKPVWIAPNVRSLNPHSYTAGSFIDAIDSDPTEFTVTYLDFSRKQYTVAFRIVKDLVHFQVSISLPLLTGERQ